MEELFQNQRYVYLSEPYHGTIVTDDCYGSITLEVLTPYGPMNSYNFITLPCNEHPYLNRRYLPSRDYIRRHPQVREDILWVGFNMECGIVRKRTERDWLLALKHAVEQGNYSVSRDPRRGGGSSRHFWMQIRGFFRYSDFNLISAAALRHVDLLRQLAQHGILIIKRERIHLIRPGTSWFSSR